MPKYQLTHCNEPIKPILRPAYKIAMIFLGPVGILLALLIPTYKCKACKRWFWTARSVDPTVDQSRLPTIIGLILLILFILLAISSTIEAIRTASEKQINDQTPE